MNEIPENYIKKFPIKLQEALKNNEKYKNKFSKYIQYEYKDIEVYRGVYNYKELSNSDFMNNVDEWEYNKQNRTINRIEHYAMSVNEDEKQIICIPQKYPTKIPKVIAIAKGTMKCELGPADFQYDNTHHNWYLYEGVADQLIENFEICTILEEGGKDNEI